MKDEIPGTSQLTKPLCRNWGNPLDILRPIRIESRKPENPDALGNGFSRVGKPFLIHESRFFLVKDPLLRKKASSN